MQCTVWMDAGRPALHNQKERRAFFSASSFIFGPPLPLSHLSGCLLNNYFTLTSLRALSLCHSEKEERRGCAVVSIVRLFQSGAFQWVFFFSGYLNRCSWLWDKTVQLCRFPVNVSFYTHITPNWNWKKKCSFSLCQEYTATKTKKGH